MTARLILEVLDGHAAVRTRVHLDTLPATIGRDYESDVVLDDPYVCPTHLHILEATGGALVAEDAGSVNGVRVGHGRERVARVTLRHGTELRLGRTIIRCCDPTRPVAPTRVEEDPPMPGWLGSSVARTVTIGASLVALALFECAGSIERTGLVTAVSQALAILMLLALWAGVWALATRVASHRFAFTHHLAFASAMAVAALTYAATIEWIDFFAPSGTAAGVFAVLVGVALLILLVRGHLDIASTMAPTRRRRAAVATAGAAVGLAVLFSWAGDGGFSNRLRYKWQLKPVPASVVPALSVDGFAAEAQSLREKVDRLAR